jgi:hypothetical protein
VLLLETRGKLRWLAAAGLAILWMGLNLPPGRRIQNEQTDLVALWHGIGGPAWSLLVAMGLLTWTGLAVAKLRPAEPPPGAPLDRPRPSAA